MTLTKRAIYMGHSSEEDMLKARKIQDNRQKKISYWKKNYGIVINNEQYDMFSKHSTSIKKILPILDFVKTLKMQ
tara:strand:+ start:688 stop:912 length:225 start_codon:yes stop_codon:yes gene_type:complete